MKTEKSFEGISKPGGGGKIQTYIPKGNGEKSGQYASGHKVLHLIRPSKQNNIGSGKPDNWPNCGWKRYPNVPGEYNAINARIKRVSKINEIHTHVSLKAKSDPNSVTKKVVDGCVIIERYYDENGEAYLDIHYSNHYDPVRHLAVPHLHELKISESGKLVRIKSEDK